MTSGSKFTSSSQAGAEWCLHWADGVDRAILQAVEAECWWSSNRTGWLVESYTRLIHGRQRLMLTEAARTPNIQSRTVR